MSISAAEASRLTGKSKQAIINAIKLGKISAIKNVDGTWQIEPVELFRHYQAVSSLNGNGHQEMDDALQPLDSPSIATLQVEVAMLRVRLADKDDVIAVKDDVIAAKDDTIMDLRSRLNVEQEERRRLAMMLTAVPQTAQLAPAKPKGFWARLLGGGE